MKTSADSPFAVLQNEGLGHRLKQALHDYSVITVYRVPREITGRESLLIVTEKQADAEALRKARWVVQSGSDLHIQINNIHRIERYFEVGNPFVYCYCRPAFLIWHRDGLAEVLSNSADRKSFKKKFPSFKESYYHDHDMLLSEADRFHNLNSPISTFLTCITVFKHNLQLLEQLYVGDHFPEETLNTRISNLIPYIPALQKLFVRQNGTSFYLINKLEAAVEAAQYEEPYVNTALYEAVKKVDAHLYQMITARFKELKAVALKEPQPAPVPAAAPEEAVEDHELASVLAATTKILSPEEIFLFHRTETFQDNAQVPAVVYFLLIVGPGIGTTAIQSVQQAVAARTKNRAGVVILGHRRITLQENLCFNQQFIQQLMTPENRIFSSSDCHPGLHWEVPHEPSYGDLRLYHRGVKDHLAQYFNLRANMLDQNSAGLFQLFAQGYLRLLRLIIYSSLCAYLPKWVASWDTWQLCLYAMPSLKQLEYLFGRLSPAFHKHIDSQLRYSDRVGGTSPEDLTVMDEILTRLSEKLDTLILEKKLDHD